MPESLHATIIRCHVRYVLKGDRYGNYGLSTEVVSLRASQVTEVLVYFDRFVFVQIGSIDIVRVAYAKYCQFAAASAVGCDVLEKLGGEGVNILEIH